ncbi:hypothetical protein DL766_008699 [Monosporascus sp. MC13-8B]|uniref:lytic cellulose monooxygenase (C4-dehydrogenating) n=1 Tax=Monosporascus cannonballus TaxID=155416 RepID=A0ABY0H1W2_9PEZI|nr:hypothetical protein DL763_008273 [Monosporascus cannonballus]RYO82638.1 hypothetical protein DL762_006511 [Monosporascus cannonballus]RYP18328.1 hypothetical protein DL766_008699 [Monosporascus sp. MC13-8B]
MQWNRPSKLRREELSMVAFTRAPLQDPPPPNLTCNDNGEALPGSYQAPVKAGGTVTAHYANHYTWDDSTLGFYCDPEDEDRKCPEGRSCNFRCMYRFWYHALGPALAYMAGYGRACALVAGSGSLSWFKVAEETLSRGRAFGDSSGYFQADLNGNYLIRHEIIMIELWLPHFYPTCATELQRPARTTSSSSPGAYSYGDMSPLRSLCTLASFLPTHIKLATGPGLSDKVAGRVYTTKAGRYLSVLPPLEGISGDRLPAQNNTVPGPKGWRGRGKSLLRPMDLTRNDAVTNLTIALQHTWDQYCDVTTYPVTIISQVARCINSRRRRKRGLRPMYGMGWMGGNPRNAQHNNAYAYNNNRHPPPAYGAPQGPSYPMHSQHPAGGYYGQQEGVQQPKNTYVPAGANDYAPPPGPPPSGRP